ncbi:formylglycine-generating enzyme family protein [Geitlerinema sp. CS-897]|nr:formylglycine-generating enzyme family protein [Geitlerinema sp. CS-897]
METQQDPRMWEAIDRVASFRRRFSAGHFDLACHAAFPLALTPDLLYRLRDYPFEPPLCVPWRAVADLLLSNLCHEVRDELYEMDRWVRWVLLDRLTQDPRYGQERLRQLSQFLLTYLQRHFQTDVRGLKWGQRWTALAYLEPEPTAKELAETLRKSIQSRRSSDGLRVTSLVETLADPLVKAGFEPLLTLSRGMGYALRGDALAAEQQFAPLRSDGNTVAVAGVEIALPPKPIPKKRFSFEVVTVDRKGKVVQQEQHSAWYFTEMLDSAVILDMVEIPGGTFVMGSPEEEEGRHEDEQPQHEVTVPSFYMGKYPVTQAQWRAVARWPKVDRDLELDPSYFKGDDRPVEFLDWFDAQEFCKRLSIATGRNYRLPSEAEWEYACRAGTITPFHFGETITTKLASYYGSPTYAHERKGNFPNATTRVGSFPPNCFGLYDMHGNVWEWCEDDWHDNYTGAPTDGSAWIENDNRTESQSNLDKRTKTERNENEDLDSDTENEEENSDRAENLKLLRGGSWSNPPVLCRSAVRFKNYPVIRNYWYGFRLYCSVARTLY